MICRIYSLSFLVGVVVVVVVVVVILSEGKV